MSSATLDPAGAPAATLAGIFVGGRSSRMEGFPKGLLPAPAGGTLVGRWASLFAALAIPVVLVGRNEAYDPLGLEQIGDAVPGIGPLGGLVALLERAEHGTVIAVACDMPYVSRTLLERLVQHPSAAPALAPHDGTIWQPLFARFRVESALELASAHAARGIGSLQTLLDRLGAARLDLDPNERAELRDWDTSRDVERG